MNLIDELIELHTAILVSSDDINANNDGQLYICNECDYKFPCKTIQIIATWNADVVGSQHETNETNDSIPPMGGTSEPMQDSISGSDQADLPWYRETTGENARGTVEDSTGEPTAVASD